MKKIIQRIIYTILLIATFIMIFGFSNQNSTISGGMSKRIITKIADILPISAEKKENVIVNGEVVLRKMAHFSIYATVGLWSILLLNTFNIKDKNKIMICILIGMIYACSDEFHQSFISGRSAQITDVILETIGTSFGTLFVFQFIW